MKNKQATSIRLSPEAKSLVEQLAKKLGISQAAVFEIAIRRLAQTENVTAKDGGSD
jgi:predicted transcriptional regulator